MYRFFNRSAVLTAVFLALILGGNLKAQEPSSKVLSLDNAIGLAVKNNHALQLSELEVDISRSRVREAKSGFYPHIETKVILPLVERESGFFLDQLIWDFNRTSNRVKSSKFRLQADKYSHGQTLQDTVHNVTVLYYAALIDRSRLGSAEKNLKKNELILEKVTEQRKLNRSSNLDLARARSDAVSSRLELLKEQNGYEESKLELLDVIGMRFDSEVELEDQEQVEFKNYELDESLERAMKNNLELKKLSADHSAQLSEIRVSKSKFYPQIYGRAAFRFEGEGGEGDPDIIAGVGFKFPIFRGFSRFAALDVSKAESTRALIMMERAKKRIQLDIKKLFMDLKFNKEKIALTRINNDVALENLSIVKEKFKLGEVSRIELLEAEAFSSGSRSDYISAIYDYKITEIKLRQIIGKN